MLTAQKDGHIGIAIGAVGFSQGFSATLAAVVNRVLPPQAEGGFLAHRRHQESQYLAEIETAFADLQRHYLPLLPRDVRGIDSLELIGRQLLGEEVAISPDRSV